MGTNIMTEFEKDFYELIDKHGLKNCAIAATHPDGNYLGFVAIRTGEPKSAFFDTAFNVGRLWQHMRNSAKVILDEFEK
jgi:hypothetical protein